MKTLFALAIALTAFSASAHAKRSPEVKGARYNADTQSIDIDVAYGGGCAEHLFKLQLEGCLESMPAQCSATVIDVTVEPDFCEAYIHQTISFHLDAYGLNDDYYSRASMKIKGANNSSAGFDLP